MKTEQVQIGETYTWVYYRRTLPPVDLTVKVIGKTQGARFKLQILAPEEFVAAWKHTPMVLAKNLRRQK